MCTPPCRLALLLLLLLALLPGCVTSVEPDVSVAMAPSEDPEYSAAFAQATKARVVFKDFETRYQLSATYLSPAFRAAFARRYTRVYKKDMVEFVEATQKAGFFVIIQSPTDDRTDLTNPQHWTLVMNTKDGPMKPILVKKLNDKERWRAFFDSVTKWTTEYLVVFDAPAVNANSPDLVEKTGINLMFANADAEVNLTW